MQLQLENPSSKSLVYKVQLRGGDSEAFSVADLGEDIVVGLDPPSPQPFVVKSTCVSFGTQLQSRQRTELEVTFRGRHVTRQPSPVTLLLVAKGGRSVAGATLAFTLHATVTGAKPMVSHVQVGCVKVAMCRWSVKVGHVQVWYEGGPCAGGV